MRYRHGRGCRSSLRYDGAASGVVRVRILGGAVEVRIEDEHAWLRGPSVLVAHGTISDEWWSALA